MSTRPSGLLPYDAGFYLVSWQIDALASQYAESTLRHLDDRLAAIEREHGLGADEVWEPDEPPPEYQEVPRQYHDAWDALFAARLGAHGEPEIATLFQADRAEYERRSAAGRQYFHGPRPAGATDDSEFLDGAAAVRPRKAPRPLNDDFTYSASMGPRR